MSRAPALPGLDVERVLGRLEGFQRAAVEHAFRRLYEVPDSTHRFLVADEVGLGKTLIARGIVAKAIEHLDREGVERIDVVYICSNQQIARQNIRRLNLTGSDRMAHADRITLLPLTIGDLAANRVNFVAFTPSTSLDLKSSLGVGRERRLLYWLLKEHWDLRGTAPKNLLQGNVKNTKWFRARLRELPERFEISADLTRAFHRDLEQAAERDRAAGRPDLRKRFEHCCRHFRFPNTRLSREQKQERAQLISDLRTQLARTCIQALEPDLVILDEFQRFKHLLDGTGEAGELAKQLFEFSDADTHVRVLLLSATPYKMYTLAHEAAEDDHYADFQRTVSFLDPDPARHAAFLETLQAWRRELYRLGDGGGDRLPELKGRIESHLRRVMSRTERVGVAGDRDAMLREVPPRDLVLTERDVEAYVHLARIGRELEQPSVLEYWKSAPFPLNLMENYQLKTELEARIDARDQGDLPDLVAAAAPTLLDWKRVAAYEPLDPPNPRLRSLVADLDRADAFRLLWVPPTLPYWRPEGAYAAAHAERFTKRLVFSAWNVVPKALAVLLSYEAERRAFRAHETDPADPPRNTPEARKRRSPLLRFTRSDGRLTGMPVLALMCASPALAELGDPLHERPTSNGSLPTLAETLERIESRLSPVLAEITRGHATDGAHDEAWYWAAPILLDLARHPEAVRAFWEQPELASAWAGVQADDDDVDKGWSEHVDEARRLVAGDLDLGRPPDDLAQVCALLALAGPATCTLRAARRTFGASAAEHPVELTLAAASVGGAFRTYFNRPESMALVRAGAADDEPYWRRVLAYAAEGGLTALLDEWVHVLRDGLGLFDTPLTDAAPALAESMNSALTLRATTHDVHELRVRRGRVVSDDHSMRAHFALRFGSEKTEDEGSQRGDKVRDAFNSPFWPLVLASTSVGQEGLDFHPFCHAVVHWNLPSNPVDLEQREGRVHRFKGHAVRRNVALRHGGAALCEPDPWSQAFRTARAEAPRDDKGLVPHWLFPIEDLQGATIERHVPQLHLSRDAEKSLRLRHSLAAYRLVFGQPRQDDLVAYLMERSQNGSVGQAGDSLRVDLAP